ncbi:TerC family protein [Brevibacillus sp. SYSU BS000544]|uniref:TerC family protein n=1 Tax=Brevibacillus sp. SYSU BS000544 TaxID=3416443 RepID=UPI003CE5B903
MEFVSTQFILALLSIIVIDLVLAGDNAIVIGMAARTLPNHLQTKAIVYGTVAAVLIRIGLTLTVSWLLQIPFLLAMGGLVLIWISYGLLVDQGQQHEVKTGENIVDAIKTIIIADVVMSLDNVIAIAGAAHGSFVLVVLGLLISVPIMVWGSTIILGLMERFPLIIYAGAAVLAWTAARMITEEPFFERFFQSPAIHYGFMAAVVIGVLAVGFLRNRFSTTRHS